MFFRMGKKRSRKSWHSCIGIKTSQQQKKKRKKRYNIHKRETDKQTVTNSQGCNRRNKHKQSSSQENNEAFQKVLSDAQRVHDMKPKSYLEALSLHIGVVIEVDEEHKDGECIENERPVHPLREPASRGKGLKRMDDANHKLYLPWSENRKKNRELKWGR